ncbi:1-deoxy-D-xylulose-5-phosphate synthase [Streptococcus hillyeri]|uniref:1-deoxy-D-xylulose-5-phosphate synthase n=1 Tax=Streptococcus hillyeri TaxID=2282420 RepID=A0A3L9DTJ9_9STRE|nr:1-deoxy-D-xylulose-5-phosphate synthase [Streptococcus hillyeri]RLY03598.1 1-deoxy-D-xylulose-5-phosphate synthase [Streptococcus hillyeri]
MTVLDKVNNPSDVKKLSLSELEDLANDIRELLVNKVSKVGGHFGPNLGVVEMTIALHKVFNAPVDKIVWDVSHQSYPHKILTGRKQGFVDGHFHDITPYTDQEESEHDFFTIGHTSTSIALAEGLAKARDIKGEKGNIIAVIGDGSMSGGLAFEGLNNAAELNSNLIVILNDNEMSIAKNYGGLYPHLAELRATNGQANNNLFKAFGFDYHYLENGHSIADLIGLFEEVKDANHPVLLHIHTEKGHGVDWALKDKQTNHWRSPFNVETGEPLKQSPAKPTFESTIVDFLEEEIEAGKPVLAMNAAIPGAFGLGRIEAKYPDHYWDSGIAEQHNISMATGFATAGAKPYIFHSATFLQRAYDQISHDLAINKVPAVLIVRGSTITNSDRTHQGTFERAMLATIPNLIYLAPAHVAELKEMLRFASQQTENPVVISIPAQQDMEEQHVKKEFATPNYDIVQKGSRVAILGLGGFLQLGKEVATELEKSGITATIINPRFIASLDEKTLESLKDNHELVVTLEDGSIDGGFGQRIAGFFGPTEVKVLVKGSLREFTEVVPQAELYDRYRLNKEQIVADILDILK